LWSFLAWLGRVSLWLFHQQLFSNGTRLGNVVPTALLVGLTVDGTVFALFWVFARQKVTSPPGAAAPGWRKIGLLGLILFMVVSLTWTTVTLVSFLAFDLICKPVLRLHGSNTIGSELAPALAASYLRHIGATDIHTAPGWRKDELFVEGIRDSWPIRIEIWSHGTSSGFVDLAHRRTDIAMASERLPIPAELSPDAKGFQELQELQYLRDNENSEYVIGLDGIAIIVPTARKLSNALTRDQVCRTFAGAEITDWSQIGGTPPGRIVRYVRGKDSGTRATLVSLCGGLLHSQDMPIEPDPHALEDSQRLSDAVADDDNAIGFVGLPFVTPSKALALSADSRTEARAPDESSIRIEEYIFTRRLYLYRRPVNTREEENNYIRDFIDFTLDVPGQEIVKRSGFVEQTIKLETPALPRDAPADYSAITNGARRVSLAVRFVSGSGDLDPKALRDLEQLKSFQLSNPLQNQKLLVLGFADPTPGPNCDVSQGRAGAVADKLRSLGVPVARVAWFGDELPLAPRDDKSNDALARSRRVEIWISPGGPGSDAPQTTCPETLSHAD
jgi:phosphate transport system substrate-binding protein